MAALSQRLFLPSFGSARSPVAESSSRHTDRLPPLAFDGDRVRLDYESLLFFNEIMLDANAFERITESTLPAFSDLAEDLRILRSEGVVLVDDYSTRLDQLWPQVEGAVREDLRHPEQWLDHVRFAVDGWDACQPRIRAHFDSHYTDAIRVPYGIAYAMQRQDRSLSDAECERTIRSILKSRRRSRSRADLDVIRDSVYPYILHANSALALAREFNAATLDWDNTAAFYTAKCAVLMDPTMVQNRRRAQAARDFFVAIPQLRITDVMQLVRVLRDARIQHFRRCVDDSLLSGNPISIDTTNSLLLDALHAQGIRVERKTWIGRIGAIASFIPGLGAVPTIVEEAAEIAADYAPDTKRPLWVYLFLDSKRRCDP